MKLRKLTIHNLASIEDAVIENQCGYIFANSTNQIKYFEQ